MSHTPNPIIVDAEVVLNDQLITDAEVESNDLLVNACMGTELRPMPHITIGEVETLPPADEAYATMTGTYADPVLNLGLVQGEKGEKGDKGDAGALGSVTASVDDSTGTPSVVVTYDGDNADFAFHNLKGAKGDKGDKGDTGAQGEQGERGLQGEQGIQGEKGETGATGATGATGNGISSAELNSNYTLTLNFTDGTSYTTPSIRGAQGAQGEQGEQGIQGERGEKGETGATGQTGAAAGFGTVSATVDNTVGTPSVEVSTSGADTAKNFSFAFHNLKGEQGQQGQQGSTGAAAGFGTVTATVDNSVGTPSVEVTTSGTDTAKNFAFAFHNIKGEPGSGAVISVNGQDGNVVLDAEDVGALPDTTVIPTKTSDLTNDSGFIDTAIYYGTCASVAADTTKVVTCADFTELKAGSAIVVNFSATNSAAVGSLKLDVNSTGAKNIKYINNGTLGNLASAGYLKANTSYLFVYDGTYWVAYFNYNTTYSSMTDAEIEAGTGTSARVITPARLKTAVQTWESVNSVNGQTGAVTLDAEDVGAMPEDAQFAIGYDEPVSVGTAVVGTAVTATPNYTPSGDVVMDYEIKDNKLYIYGFRFVGSGVNFVVEKNVQSNAVGTGAADYMEI